MSRNLPERFQVLEELAQDPAKTLLRCRDTVLLREVVLQIPGSAQRGQVSGADRDRMLREARMLARVQHPSVRRLLEVFEGAAGPIMVLEPRAGETLAERLDREGQLNADDVRKIGLSISDAAEAVHAAGVVHRGINENNILIEPEGHAVLTGFEFSKGLSRGFGDSSIDYKSSRAGLPSYPAPEQLKGELADARSDVFGLGCVLYRCLTGRSPFPDGEILPWEEPEDPRALAPDAPQELTEIIGKCLRTSPLSRYQSMAELHDALQTDADSPEGASAGAGAGAPPASRRPSRSLRAAALAVVILILAPALWYLISRSQPVDRHVAQYAQSHALLIGIDYVDPPSDFPRLWNAERDVLAIEKRLREIGWRSEDIRILTGAEATKVAIERALRELEDESGSEDQLFIYYSGHGMQHEKSQKSGYAIPSDARDDDHRTNWLHFDTFDRVFDHSEAKHILIALDCCYSGAFLSRSSIEEYNFSETLLTRRAHLMMVSSRDGLAADSTHLSSDHSPFAAAFLESLEEAVERPKTATSIQARAQEFVQAQTWAQVPILYHRLRSSSGTSDFVFINRANGTEAEF